MTDKPRADLKPNTLDYEIWPLVSPNGFREYDARWLFGKELNLLGVQAVGLGLGTYFHELGIAPQVVTGHDYRSYSLSIKQALIARADGGRLRSARHRACRPRRCAISRNSRSIVRGWRW